jgi:hypothetical protein
MVFVYGDVKVLMMVMNITFTKGLFAVCCDEKVIGPFFFE